MNKPDNLIRCPEYSSSEVLVYAETAYEVNSGDFYCHSVKTHDSDARVRCNDCDWQGQQDKLFFKSK